MRCNYFNAFGTLFRDKTENVKNRIGYAAGVHKGRQRVVASKEEKLHVDAYLVATLKEQGAKWKKTKLLKQMRQLANPTEMRWKWISSPVCGHWKYRFDQSVSKEFSKDLQMRIRIFYRGTAWKRFKNIRNESCCGNKNHCHLLRSSMGIIQWKFLKLYYHCNIDKSKKQTAVEESRTTFFPS